MTNSLNALIEIAENRGYRIMWHRGGPKAAWLPHHSAVTLRVDLMESATLCALAHELGHAHYHDPPGHEGWREKRADKFAARLLVSPVEYAAAEALYGPQPQLIAAELGVTIKILKTWKALYERQSA